MRGRVGVGRGESAGGETCPCGGGRARGEESLLAVRPVHAGRAGGGRGVGKRTLSRTHGRKRIGRRDGEGSLLVMRPVPCGGGRA